MSSSTPWRRSATASTRTWPRILIQDRPSRARRRGGSRARTRPGPRAPRRRAAAGGPRSDGTRAARGRRPAPRRRRRPRRRRGATATGGGGSRPRPRTGGPSRVWIGCASRTRHQIRMLPRGNGGVRANLRISNTLVGVGDMSRSAGGIGTRGSSHSQARPTSSLSSTSSSFLTKRPLTRRRVSAKLLRTSYCTDFFQTRRFRLAWNLAMRLFLASGE